jgi:hypothetical protein
MAKIVKILRTHDLGDSLKIWVELDDGMQAIIYVGGAVETFFHKGQIRAFVKKSKA